MLPERYLITHAPACTCADRTPYRCDSPYDATRYLSGRRVSAHTLYEGEYPYRFCDAGDPRVLEAVLLRYPAARVRHMVPRTVTLEALQAAGACVELRHDAYGALGVVCVIGEREASLGETPRDTPSPSGSPPAAPPPQS